MPAITLPLRPTADDLAHLENDHTRKYAKHLLNPKDEIRQRIIMERAVVRRALRDMLDAGNWVRVFYGQQEGYGCDRTDNLDVAMAALQACDIEHLLVFPNSSDRRIGHVMLVYGNSGWEVIADNSEFLEPLLAGASKYADQLADAEDATQWAHDERGTPEDTPTVANCNDWGTGEGQYHGRI